GLEQFLLARPHGAVGELPLHHLQPLGDLSLVGAGAVAAEQELDHVGRHGVLSLEAAHKVLADEIPFKGRRGLPVDGIQLHVHSSAAPVVACRASTWPSGASTTTAASRPAASSSATSSAALPSGSSALGAAREEPGSAAFVRMSTRSPSTGPSTLTRQRRLT